MKKKKIKTVVIHDKSYTLIQVTNGSLFHQSNIDLEKYTYKVETIGNEAFKKCRKMKSLIIPRGTLFIEQYAFMFVPNLESLVIPGSIEYFEECAFPLSDSSFAPKLKNIIFKWNDKEQVIHSDTGFEKISKMKNGEFICKISDNKYIVVNSDMVKETSKIDISQITDRYNFLSRFEHNSYANGKPDVNLSNLNDSERQSAIKEFSEGLPSLEKLLHTFLERDIISTGCCAGHDTNGGFLSFYKDNIPSQIQKKIFDETKKMGSTVKKSENHVYIDIPFLNRDDCFNLISTLISPLPIKKQKLNDNLSKNTKLSHENLTSKSKIDTLLELKMVLLGENKQSINNKRKK